MTDERKVEKVSSDKPIFKVQKDLKTGVIPSLRVTSEMEDAIKDLSGMSNLPINEVVRQMLQFALDHREKK